MTEGTLELVAVVEKTATDEKGGEDVEGEREAPESKHEIHSAKD